MIKNKLLVIITVILLCSVIILLAHFQFFEARESTLKLYGEKQIVLAKQVSLSIEKFFEERIRALELIAEKPEMYNLNKLEYVKEFENVYNKIGSFKYIIFMKEKSGIESHYPRQNDFTFNNDQQHSCDIFESFNTEQSKQQSKICEYSFVNNEADFVCICVPVYNLSGTFLGVLLGVIDLKESLSDVIDPYVLNENVHIFILSSTGVVIYHPVHPEMVRNNINDNTGYCLECHDNFNLEKRILTEQSGWSQKRESKTKEKLLSFSKVNLPGVSWSLAIDMPYQVITEANSKQFIVFFLLSASMIVVVIIGSFSIYRINKDKIEIEKESVILKTRSQLLESIEEAEAKYRSLVEQSPDAIAIYQNKGFIFANEKFINLFGYSYEIITSREFFIEKLVGEESIAYLKNIFEQMIQKREKQINFSLQGKTNKNQNLDLEISIYRFLLKNKIAYQIVAHDVTEIKKKERETSKREHLAFIGEMSARIAHEIKNPLASLQAGIQLLESNIISDIDGQEYFHRLTNEVQRVDRIVKGLLGYAREEQIVKKKVNLGSVIKNVVELIKPTIKNAEIDWSIKYDTKNQFVYIDKNKMEQVVWNLLINSVQSIEKKGQINIIIKPGNNGDIQMEISDTGHGISKENVENLFKPFFSTKSQGTGLGLANSKKIINAHGGTIELISEMQKGTTAKIYIPRM